MDRLFAAIEVADLHLAEVVLAELPGQPLKAHLQPHVVRPQACHQLVEGALAALVFLKAFTPKKLNRQQAGFLLQQLLDQGSKRLGDARPPDGRRDRSWRWPAFSRTWISWRLS